MKILLSVFLAAGLLALTTADAFAKGKGSSHKSSGHKSSGSHKSKKKG